MNKAIIKSDRPELAKINGKMVIVLAKVDDEVEVQTGLGQKYKVKPEEIQGS